MKQEIKIPMEWNRSCTVPVVYSLGDYAVHRAVELPLSGEPVVSDPKSWKVTHIPSGRSIYPYTIWTRKEAVELCRKAAALTIRFDGKGKIPKEFVTAVIAILPEPVMDCEP